MADDERFAELKYDERYRQGKHSGFGQNKHHQAGKMAKHGNDKISKSGNSKRDNHADSHQVTPKIDKRFIQDAKTFDEEYVPNKYGGIKKNKNGVTKELKEMTGEDEEEDQQEIEDHDDVSEDAPKIKTKSKAYRDPEAGFEWNEETSDEEIDMDRVNELLGNNVDEEDAWTEDESEALMIESSSKRLALMNYDWSKIHAGDLMITFSSFLPEGGILKKVSVYPSEFGIKKLAEEEEQGPGDIFKESADRKEDDGDSDNTTRASIKKKVQEEPKSKKLTRHTVEDDWAVSHEDTRSGLDVSKLRKYERDRLKYYYAVLEFDSGKTADSVYESCNGFELEKTGIKIGKQFI